MFRDCSASKHCSHRFQESWLQPLSIADCCIMHSTVGSHCCSERCSHRLQHACESLQGTSLPHGKKNHLLQPRQECMKSAGYKPAKWRQSPHAKITSYSQLPPTRVHARKSVAASNHCRLLHHAYHAHHLHQGLHQLGFHLNIYAICWDIR